VGGRTNRGQILFERELVDVLEHSSSLPDSVAASANEILVVAD
jgi:hypothetical protein